MGNDEGAYMMSDELEDQGLVMQDMKTHMMIHLAGVSAVMGNENKEYMDAAKATDGTVR